MKATTDDKLFTECYEYAFKKAKDEINPYGFSPKRTIRLVRDIALELIEKGIQVIDAIPDYDNGCITVKLRNPYHETEVSFIDILVNQTEPAKSSPFVDIKETVQIGLRVFCVEVGKSNHPFGPYTREHVKIGNNWVGQDIYNFGTFADDIGTAVRVVNKFNTVMENWQSYIQAEKEAFKQSLE